MPTYKRHSISIPLVRQIDCTSTTMDSNIHNKNLARKQPAMQMISRFNRWWMYNVSSYLAYLRLFDPLVVRGYRVYHITCARCVAGHHFSPNSLVLPKAIASGTCRSSPSPTPKAADKLNPESSMPDTFMGMLPARQMLRPTHK